MSVRIPPRTVADLPETLPLLPQLGTLLLPAERLPIIIQEPRYVELMNDSLAWHRLIGVIQPEPEAAAERTPRLCTVGCAGRITSFNEFEPGRYHLILSGLCRFKLSFELPVASTYRQARVDFAPFAHDMMGPDTGMLMPTNRERLLLVLRKYLNLHKVADWSMVQGLATEALINWLGMICPFDPREKQALLEARTMAEREAILMTIIEIAVFGRTSPMPA
jgi:Lon protease-like protein